jgi:hypothetical protein
MTACNAVYDTKGGSTQFQKYILEYASLDYDWRFIKTGTIKLANSRYLSCFEPKPAVLNSGKLRELAADFKGVHKPGRASAGEVPGLFTTQLPVISIVAIYRPGDRCNDPLIKRTDQAGGYSMSSRSASMQP